MASRAEVAVAGPRVGVDEPVQKVGGPGISGGIADRGAPAGSDDAQELGGHGLRSFAMVERRQRAGRREGRGAERQSRGVSDATQEIRVSLRDEAERGIARHGRCREPLRKRAFGRVASAGGDVEPRPIRRETVRVEMVEEAPGFLPPGQRELPVRKVVVPSARVKDARVFRHQPFLPSMPVRRSPVGGCSPSQTDQRALMKSGPGIVPFRDPANSTVVPVPGS